MWENSKQSNLRNLITQGQVISTCFFFANKPNQSNCQARWPSGAPCYENLYEVVFNFPAYHDTIYIKKNLVRLQGHQKSNETLKNVLTPLLIWRQGRNTIYIQGRRKRCGQAYIVIVNGIGLVQALLHLRCFLRLWKTV